MVGPTGGTHRVECVKLNTTVYLVNQTENGNHRPTSLSIRLSKRPKNAIRLLFKAKLMVTYHNYTEAKTSIPFFLLDTDDLRQEYHLYSNRHIHCDASEESQDWSRLRRSSRCWSSRCRRRVQMLHPCVCCSNLIRSVLSDNFVEEK